jgi:DNA-binding CsgD family transcriptional regulator
MTAMISHSPGARGRMTPRERPAGGEVVRGRETEQKMVRDLLRRARRGVAARMYLSTHTVAHHLRQAFRKLSIASRVELTRIVIEQAAGPAGAGSPRIADLTMCGEAAAPRLARDQPAGLPLRTHPKGTLA